MLKEFKFENVNETNSKKLASEKIAKIEDKIDTISNKNEVI